MNLILFRVIRLLIFILIPYLAFADKHVPYYKSLSKSESWLRHYPDLKIGRAHV